MDILPLKLKAAGMPCDAEHIKALSFHPREDLSGGKKVHIRCKGKTIIDENEVDSLVKHLVDKKQWDSGLKKHLAAKPVDDPDPFEGSYADEPPSLDDSPPAIPRFDGNYVKLAHEFMERVCRACRLFYGSAPTDYSQFTMVRHVPSLDIEIFLGDVARHKVQTGENKPVLSVEETRIFCNNYGVDMPCLYSALLDHTALSTKDDRTQLNGPPPSGEVVVTIKKKKRRLG